MIHLFTQLHPVNRKLIHEALSSLTTLENNTLYRMLPSTPTLAFPKEQLKQVSIFLSGADRKDFNTHKVDLLPNHFSDIPSLLLQRDSAPVIMATVSPMDKEGYFSLGTSVVLCCTFIKTREENHSRSK